MQNLKYNSLIEIVTIDGIEYIDKKLRLSLNRNEAEEIRQKVLLQRHAFEKMHVPTSKLVNIEVMKDDKGYWLNIREVFAGLDFMDVVNNDNFAMYLERLLQDIFKPLLKSTSEDYLGAGIDPILRNFVYDNKVGEFCYVDFMPPKVFYKGKFCQEIPECPDLDFYNVRIFSHNLRAGVVYVLFVNLVREFPTQLRFVAARLEQFLKEIGEIKLYEYIYNSPLYRAHDLQSVKETIKKLGDWKYNNYYLLREIANWLNSHNKRLEIDKKEVYRLTSQERDVNSPDYGRISSANFLETLNVLLAAVEKCE